MRTPALLRSELLKLGSIPYYIRRHRRGSLHRPRGRRTGDGLHLTPLAPTRPAGPGSLRPRRRLLLRFQFAELAFGALGVLAITTEYASGTMHATLVASPRRTRVYVAKLAALILVVLPVCVASTFAAFILGQRAIADRRLDVTLSDPHVLRAVIGAALYMVVVTLVGFGLGAVIRHTAGALTVMFALVFLAWPLARAVEASATSPTAGSLSMLPTRS